MRRIGAVLLGVCLSTLAGCRHQENSQVVKLFQDAGGGDANKSTPEGIVQFLGPRDDLRGKLTPLCNQKKSGAPADWSTTDEGRIWTRNASANFFGKTTIKSDGVKF